MKCICEDWKENIPKINGPLSFMAASRPYMLEGMDLGKEFVYCPWCGFKLLNDNEDDWFCIECKTDGNTGGKCTNCFMPRR